jgi:hypothetical protein
VCGHALGYWLGMYTSEIQARGLGEIKVDLDMDGFQ